MKSTVATALDGPSPRVWGERAPCRRCVEATWTIPTRVGRTLAMATLRRPVYCGPSPRVWGEPRDNRRSRSPTSDHPHACGENSTPKRGDYSDGLDHPHAGGEKRALGAAHLAAISSYCGPSPTRGWGEPACLDGIVEHAMSAGRGPSPRGWGEHVIDRRQRAEARPMHGPSPRVWGERSGIAHRWHRAVVDRTIPTRVGRTDARAPCREP